MVEWVFNALELSRRVAKQHTWTTFILLAWNNFYPSIDNNDKYINIHMSSKMWDQITYQFPEIDQ